MTDEPVLRGPRGAKIELVWEDPPEPVSEYDKIVEQLKAKPNQWAKVREAPTSGGPYNTLKHMKNAKNAAGLEGKVVRVDEDVYALYARYVPKGPKPE